MKTNLKNNIIIFSILAIGIFMIPNFASALTTYDNFNSYSGVNGLPNGPWIPEIGDWPQASQLDYYPDGGTTSALSNGTGIVWRGSSGFIDGSGLTFYIKTQAGSSIGLGFDIGYANFEKIGTCSNGKFCIGSNYFSNYIPGEWVSVELKWLSSNGNKISARFNGGNWTDFTSVSFSPGGITRIAIMTTAIGDYLDNIQIGIIPDPLLPTAILTMSSTTAPDLLAYAGRLFTDLKSIIILLIGIPVGFYIINKAISLITSRTRSRKFSEAIEMSDEDWEKGGKDEWK